MRAFALPRIVVLPVFATAAAGFGFSLTPMLAAGLPRLFGFAGIAITAILAVAVAQGLKESALAAILTGLTADFFFLGPPLEFGVSKPCHYVVLASVAVVSTIGTGLIEMRRSARAAQLARPVGMAVPESRDVLVCEPYGNGQIKAVRLVRDI